MSRQQSLDLSLSCSYRQDTFPSHVQPPPPFSMTRYWAVCLHRPQYLQHELWEATYSHGHARSATVDLRPEDNFLSPCTWVL